MSIAATTIDSANDRSCNAVPDPSISAIPLANAGDAAVRECDGELFRRRWPLFWPITGLACVSLLIRWMSLDLLIASQFYDETARVWPYELAQPWLTIYRQGTIPSFVLGIGGLVVAALGCWILPWSQWRHSKPIRRAGLFLGLMLLLGPGLIVNVGFKHLWGRPRPIQCVEFNGDKPFLPVGTWAGERSRNSSFPSGHAAVAFYLMAPGFIVGSRRPRLTATYFLGGTAFGLSMGLTRVIQGGHFVTDVLWAGAFVYLTGVALSWLMLRKDGLFPVVE